MATNFTELANFIWQASDYGTFLLPALDAKQSGLSTFKGAA